MIPFFSPSLPKTTLNPYFSEIDENRWYSNFGPLVTKFETRLNNHFGINGNGVVTFSNGTLALMGLLSTLDLPFDAKILIPSWTFAATPLSAKILGYDVVYGDIDPNTWALTPQIAYDICDRQSIDAVIVVCPFGAPIDVKAWEIFQLVTGVPVIIDAAAAFANIKPSIIPQMVSLHPTKIFSSGEGGLVVCLDESRNQRLRYWSNFGFDSTRESLDVGINAKMNEYNAAIGLASLDQWNETYEKYMNLGKLFADYLEEIPFITAQDGFADTWISSSIMLQTQQFSGDIIMRHLNNAGIEARRWWGKPCHQQRALIAYDDFPITEHIYDTLFSIPFHLHLQPSQIEYMFTFLHSLMQQGPIRPILQHESPTTCA